MNPVTELAQLVAQYQEVSNSLFGSILERIERIEGRLNAQAEEYTAETSRLARDLSRVANDLSQHLNE